MWKLVYCFGCDTDGYGNYYLLCIVVGFGYFSLEKVEGKNEHAVDDPEEIASMVDM